MFVAILVPLVLSLLLVVLVRVEGSLDRRIDADREHRRTTPSCQVRTQVVRTVPVRWHARGHTRPRATVWGSPSMRP